MPASYEDRGRRAPTLIDPRRSGAEQPSAPRHGGVGYAARPRDPADDVAAARAAVSRARAPHNPRSSGPARRRALVERLRGFVRRYGWRAYAIPLMVLVTVVALVSSTSGSPAKDPAKPVAAAGGQQPSTAAPAPSHIALKDDSPGPGAITKIPKGYALPAGAPYTFRGDGTFRVLKGTSPPVGHGTLYRYSIDVENGVKGIDLEQFQRDVVTVLSDKRSWSGHGVRLQRVDSGHIDFHVTMTSAKTVRGYCGYSIPVETSCYAPAGTNGLPVNRVIFDDARWVRGSTAYLGDLPAYREYMINHEDGHALGHEHAHQCLPGGLAPAMMQQTFGLRSAVTGKLCEANPWPYPTGVHGAPGKEGPDNRHNDEYEIGD